MISYSVTIWISCLVARARELGIAPHSGYNAHNKSTKSGDGASNNAGVDLGFAPSC